jgi:hypothetical protein
MPTLKQMEKLATEAARRRANAALAPEEPLPPGYTVLQDPRALSMPPETRQKRLSEIESHVLRVSCRRCGRIVEVQKVDAVRLAGPQAVWKDLAQRLLDGTCTQRTGRHEEDGCWPSFE